MQAASLADEISEKIEWLPYSMWHIHRPCATILSMTPSHEHIEVTLGRQGRLVIPAVLRKELGLAPGTSMVARIENNRLVLEKPDAIWARIEGRFSPIPSTVHLADELIAERREMAKRENQA